ncbi:MAG: glycosyltransferase [Desulfuromonadales bacterium]|nr:glycosyltransferase [Desulfuromonadales bacterium]
MPSPTVDIIVPVWNNHFEARTCLSAILTHSPEARLIIVDNGSNRQTQLVLEEFSEPLGEQCLFLYSEKNVGHVRAINRGLSRSDSDFAVIVRPHVTVTKGWLGALLQAAERGIASPVFSGEGAPFSSPFVRGCSLIETSAVSFSVLALKRELHLQLGGFDEQLDGGEWCLKDYVSRAASKGFRTCITSGSTVVCDRETILGSDERRREQARASRSVHVERWGAGHHYGVYFGRNADANGLADAVEIILRGARQGHRFTLLLHASQASVFRRMGWNGLHTSIELRTLSRFAPRHDLRRFCLSHPDMVAVLGAQGAAFNERIPAIPFSTVLCEIGPP